MTERTSEVRESSSQKLLKEDLFGGIDFMDMLSMVQNDESHQNHLRDLEDEAVDSRVDGELYDLTNDAEIRHLGSPGKAVEATLADDSQLVLNSKNDKEALNVSHMTTASEFFNTVDRRFDQLAEVNLSKTQSEVFNKSKIVTTDELIEKTRKRFSFVPEPQPNPNIKIEEAKRQKMSLLNLFRLFGEATNEENLDVTTPKKHVSLNTNPLDYLDDSTIFNHKSKIVLSGPKAEESKTHTGPRILQVVKYPLLNNLKALPLEVRAEVSCLAMKGELLVMGTTKGDFYEVNIVADKAQSVTHMDQPVYSVDISEDFNLVAAGGFDGKLFVKSVGNTWGKKTLNASKFDNSPIKQIKFINDKELIAVGGGLLYRCKFGKIGPVLDLKSSHLVVTVQSLEYIPTKFEYFVEKQSNKLLVGSAAKVSFFKVLPIGESLEYSFQRPAGALEEDHCMFKSVGQSSSIYVVIWGKILTIIKKLNIQDDSEDLVGAEGDIATSTGHYQILENIDLAYKSDFSCMFNQFGLLFMRHDGMIRSVGLGVYSKYLTKGCFYELEESIYWEFPNLSKNYNKFFQNIKNKYIRLADDTVVFLDNAEFVRFSLINADDLITEYQRQGEWHHAIKIAVRLFNSAASSEKAITKMKERIQILSSKYVSYFLESVKPSSNLELDLHEEFDHSRAEATRLRLIFQTLLCCKSSNFIFESLSKKVRQNAFWFTIGDLINRGVAIHVKLSYINEQMINFLNEDQLITLIEASTIQGPVNESDGNTPEVNNNELLSRLLQLMQRREYWRAAYRLCLQYPSLMSVALFLSILLTNAMPKTGEQQDKLHWQLEASQLQELYIEGARGMSSQSGLVHLVRLFFYIRKLIHLIDISYLKHRESLWQQLLDWLFDKTNIVLLAKLNLNLVFECLCEAFLKTDLILNQAVLQHLQKSVRSNSSVYQFQIIDTSDFQVSAKLTSRKLTTSEVKEYTLRVVKELFEYLFKVLNKTFGDIFEQDVGFLAVKLTNITIFCDLSSDTPLCFQYLMKCLSKPFRENNFYYFYKILSHAEFESIVNKCLEKVLSEAKFILPDSLEELFFVADKSRL